MLGVLSWGVSGRWWVRGLRVLAVSLLLMRFIVLMSAVWSLMFGVLLGLSGFDQARMFRRCRAFA